MKHFLVYDVATGAPLRSGVCEDHLVNLQARAEEGEAVMETVADAITVAEVNLAPVRQALHKKVDDEAEALRMRFITPGSGQAITYLRKETEARAFQADSGADTPLLAAEADALGIAVADLANEVIAAANLWLVIGSRIEAARRSAKELINSAQNVAEMHAASVIDWSVAIADPSAEG